VICRGCKQKNTITGVYLNEANNDQYILSGEMGTFSHYNYNNRPDTFRTGNFEVNNSHFKQSYSDGEISVFTIEENELVPINENRSISIDKLREKRFATRLKI
jgi:hypothetical protein